MADELLNTTQSDHASSTFLSLAQPLLNRGWSPIPIDGKVPCIRWKEYQRRQASLSEVIAWAKQFPTANLGLVLGPVTGVVAVDLDADDPMEAIRLGEITNEMLGRSPVDRVGCYPRRVGLYRAERVRSQAFGKVEILARGRVVTMYGVHPLTGEPYQHHGTPLTELRPNDLPRITRRQIAQFRNEVMGLASHVGHVREHTRQGGTGLTLDEAMCGVPLGKRHSAMFTIGSAFRGAGKPQAEAEDAVAAAAMRCKPPYSVQGALAVVHWYPFGEPRF